MRDLSSLTMACRRRVSSIISCAEPKEVWASVSGEFGLVGVGRMLISNPQWPNQLRDGRIDEIRPYSNVHLMTLD